MPHDASADIAAKGASLTIERVAHRYGSAVALEQISLHVAGGELLSLLGPSGCGKTTLLRIVGGFIEQSAGRVLIQGEAVDHLPPNRRSVGIVFQNYALFPHMTVARNIAYGLQARRMPGAEIRARVREMLALVRLEHLAERTPQALSGGQQQRVALARALAVRPSILLLDEPFAALDKNLRLDMQIEVKRIQRLSGTTTILVTHDQEEALSLSDRIAVLNQGRLEQLATPTEIYDRPASLFVNTFVGTANVIPGVLASLDDAGAMVTLEDGATIAAGKPSGPVALGDRVVVCIRPEHLRIGTAGAGLTGTVEMGLPLGATIVHEIRTPAGISLKVAEPRTTGMEPRAPGAVVTLIPFQPEAVGVFRAAA
ncbi:MAG: ABC transporter ATP-binding protein [Acetobacteraceae bacterium]